MVEGTPIADAELPMFDVVSLTKSRHSTLLIGVVTIQECLAFPRERPGICLVSPAPTLDIGSSRLVSPGSLYKLVSTCCRPDMAASDCRTKISCV